MGVFGLLIAWGIWSTSRVNLDAIPDIGEIQVTVLADWMGRSPKDIEDQVIYPLTASLLGIPRVKAIRSSSSFSFGMVNVVFQDGTDFYWARTRVLEKLNTAKQSLPEGVTPVLGPDATAVGQIFWYSVENGYYCPDHPQTSYDQPGKCPIDGNKLIPSTLDLGELRTLQDWYIRYQLNATPGVSEVAGIGGMVREYQIDVDPKRLLSYGIRVSEVMMAVSRSNLDVGAKVMEEGGMEFLLRGVGFIKKTSDIENIVVGKREGVPVYVKNIGAVQVGPAFRRGILDKEGREITGGVVLMRFGENPLKVIERIKQKVEELKVGLPPGVRVVPFYDRTGLIKRTINTLTSALIQETAVTIAVILLMLMHLASGAIVSMVMPVGILIAFFLMYLFRIDANVMSLGGIAIAIGVMVDFGCIMIENIYRHLSEEERRSGSALKPAQRLEACRAAALEVGPPVFTALMTTVIAFIPVFMLTGQSGKLFRPLAFTKTFAIFGAGLIALCLLPVLSYYLLRGKMRLADEIPATRFFRNLYRPSIRWCLKRKLVPIVLSAAVLAAGILVYPRISREFMPPLNEGDLLFMPVLLPGASLTQTQQILQTQDRIIKENFPGEVAWVVGKLGRVESATDPAPITMFETIIHLKPVKEWRKKITREKLISEITEATGMPGVSPIMTQPIRNRIDMLASGIQTPVGVKVFGADIAQAEALAVRIEQIVGEIPGARNPYAERVGNLPYLEIKIDREKAARYGISVADLQDIIEMAVGGATITTTVEGRERYPVRIRYLRELRDTPEALAGILIPTAGTAQIPLNQLATIEKIPGPAMISTENTLPYVRIFINVDQSKIGLVDFVGKAQKRVQEEIKSGRLSLPPGYFIQWSGQYESELEARNRLKVAFPLVFFGIILFLYFQFRRPALLLLVMTGLPISLAGGFILLSLLSFKISIAVWVGFIALFGVATDDAVLVLNSVMDKMRGKTIKNKEELRETVAEGSVLRVRPVLMTTLTTLFALLPVMFLSGAGSEVIKPMAIPTLGGLALATLTNLYLLPVLYAFLLERNLKRDGIISPEQIYIK